jgi:hypothetical protein
MQCLGLTIVGQVVGVVGLSEMSVRVFLVTWLRVLTYSASCRRLSSSATCSFNSSTRPFHPSNSVSICVVLFQPISICCAKVSHNLLRILLRSTTFGASHRLVLAALKMSQQSLRGRRVAVARVDEGPAGDRSMAEDIVDIFRDPEHWG